MVVARLSRGTAQTLPAESLRAPTMSANDLQGVVPAVGTSAPSVPPPQQGYIFYEWSARSQRRHGPSSATGTRAPTAVPPCRGSNSAMGARARNAVPLNHDTRACTSRARPGHPLRSKKAAPTARRPHTRAGSSLILRGREAAVGLRCGKPTQVRRDCLRDSTRCLFAIGAGALSTKEEPTTIATYSPSSKRAKGNEPTRAGNIFPLARIALPKTPVGSTEPAPSLGTPTHVHQTTSAPVAQDRDPTLRNGPVVTTRPPARLARCYPREDTGE